MLQRKVVHEFYMVCKRRDLKINASKSKVLAPEMRKGEMVDFAMSYRISKCITLKWKVRMNDELLEEVREFKYMGLVRHNGRGNTGESCPWKEGEWSLGKN